MKKSPEKLDGFTLLELLMVVAIMGLMMVIAVVSFVGLSQGARMKATVLNVRSSLAHARQYAITKRTKALFVCGNSNSQGRLTGYYYVATNACSSTNCTIQATGLVGPMNYASDGILFTNTPPETKITFDLDGSCVKDETWGTGLQSFRKPLVLYEALPSGSPRPNGLTTTSFVYRLTGRVKGGGWVNE